MGRYEAPGRNLWFTALIFMSIGVSESLMPNHFTTDELEMLFGPDGCIEGELTLMPTSPSLNPVLAAIPLAQQSRKPTSVLMGLQVAAPQMQVYEQIQQEQQSNRQTIINMTMNTTTTPTTTKIPTVSSRYTSAKTPINLANELARFNKIQHQYQLTNEQGLPHEKRFTVTLKLGGEEYTAEGASIKKAQHSAASEALKHTLYKHPPPKTPRNVHHDKSFCLDPNADLKGPISVVNEIAHKINLPVNFEVVSQEGPPHMPTFVTKCIVGDKVTTGEGNSKKLSKKSAAEKMLEELKKLSSGSTCWKHKTKKKRNGGRKKYRKLRNLIKLFQGMFYKEQKSPVEQMPTVGSQEMFPDLLLMSDDATSKGNGQTPPTKNSGKSFQKTTTIAKEHLKEDSLPSAEALAKSRTNHRSSSPVGSLKTNQKFPHLQDGRPKDRLLNLAQRFGFGVQFSDFPHGKDKMFLSLVSLSTDTPRVCFGTGSTYDASHDQAALTALRALTKIGLGSDSLPDVKIKSEPNNQYEGLDLIQPNIKETEVITLFK